MLFSSSALVQKVDKPTLYVIIIMAFFQVNFMLFSSSALVQKVMIIRQTSPTLYVIIIMAFFKKSAALPSIQCGGAISS